MNCSSSARNRGNGKFTATSLPPPILPQPNNACFVDQTLTSSSKTNTLTGKVALATGGSRGIGAAIVRRLAEDGADVAFGYVG
jgi:3-oxoacyl-ACP reductase-like protein